MPIMPSRDESEDEMNSSEGRERGEKRAEGGIRRGAFRHEQQIRGGMIQFLDCLLASPTSCSTLDAATDDLALKHADGGKWRASIPKRLKALGLIVSERVVKSARPPRHAGYLTEWRLVNRSAAIATRAVLAAILQTDAGESAGTDSPAATSIINPQSKGAEDYGQAL